MKRRPNGAGTVTQRKDGQWEGRIRFRDDGHKLIIKSCFADIFCLREGVPQIVGFHRIRMLLCRAG